MQNSNTSNTQIEKSQDLVQQEILKNLIILSLKNIIRNNCRQQPMFKQIYQKVKQQSHLSEVEIFSLFQNQSFRMQTQEYLIGFSVIQDIFDCTQIQNKNAHINQVKTLFILSRQVEKNIQ